MLTVFRFKLWLVCFFCFITFGLNAQESDYDSWKKYYNRGLYLLKEKNFKQAEVVFQEAYNVANNSIENKETLANSSYYLGVTFVSLKRESEAIPLFEKTMNLLESIKNINKESYLIKLNYIGGFYVKKGLYGKAILLFNNTNDLLEAKGKINTQLYAENIFRIGETNKNLGNYEKALINLKQSLKLFKILFGDKHLSYGENLSLISVVLKQQGKFKEAIIYAKDALKVFKQSQGERSTEYASALTKLSQVYYENGDYDKAIKLQKESLKLFSIEAKKTLQYDVALNALAKTYFQINDYQNAKSLFIEVINRLGEDHKQTPLIKNSLGLTYQRMGDYENSFKLNMEAIKKLDKQNPNYVTVLQNLALNYARLGEYKKALGVYKEALEIIEPKKNKNSELYAKLLNNIGKLQAQMGNKEEARELFKKAIDYFLITQSIDHPQYGYYVNDFANALLDLGYIDEALKLMVLSIEIAERNDKINTEAYFKRQYNLANIYNTMDDYNKALPLIINATSKTAKLLGNNHKDYGEMLKTLSKTYVGLNDVDKAMQAIKTSNTVFIQQLDKIFKFRSEREKKAFLGLIVNNFDELQSLMVNNIVDYEKLSVINLNNQLMLKGLLLNNTKDILNKLESLNDSVINNDLIVYRTLKNKYAKEISKSELDRTYNIDSLKQTLNKQEANLVSTYNNHYKNAVKLIKNWESAQLNLRENEIAIEFSNFRLSRNNKLTGSIMYVAYVYNKEWQYPKMVTLFEENELTSILAIRSTNQLYNSNELYNLLWKPLESYIANSNIVYYSPSGLLNQISFSAIKNETETLNNKYHLVQLSSTDILAQGTTEPSLTSALFIGGIDYDYTETVDLVIDTTQYAYLQTKKIMQTRGTKSRGESWDELPATLAEIEDLQSILQSQGTGFNILKGKQATEANFKKLSGNSPSILHIATHGFFYENREQKPKHKMGLSTEDQYRLAEDPLQRSGLILAGANYAWKHGANPIEDEDGILSALEISNMDLSNTDIVILSACETGLGDIDGSEGVYGLQRAFKMAGVNIIVMSLWQVPDEETAEFMNLFYSNWIKNKNVRNAFNDAQRTIQNKYKDEPLKWAAFVMFE